MQLNLPLKSLDLNLDPHKMEDADSMFVLHQLYRGLFRYNYDGNVQADLVEKWSSNDSQTQFTFNLKNANFSDGSRLEAKHVVLSMARLFYVGSSMGADLEYIRGAVLFRKTKNLADLGIQATTPDKVVFELNRASPLFFKHLAAVDTAIMKINDYKAPLPQNIFSGPYTLEKFDKTELILKKWRSDKFESKAPPQKISFVKVAPADIVQVALRGEIHSADQYNLTLAEIKKLEDKKWFKTLTAISSEQFVLFNPKQISLADRKAISNSVDKALLVKALDQPGMVVANGIIPESLPGHLTAADTKNIVMKNTKKDKVKSFTVTVSKDGPLLRRTAEILADQWSGFPHKIHWVSHEEYLRRLFSGDFDVILASKGLDYPDGYANLAYLKSDYVSNYFFIKLKTVDDLLDQAVHETNEDLRIQLYKKIQYLTLEQMVILPLFFGSGHSGLWHPKLTFVPGHPLGLHYLSLETLNLTHE